MMTRLQQTIGVRLRQCRKQRGLSQQALAELSQNTLSQVRIGQWENALREPSLDTINTLAILLDVSPSYLLCLSDDPQGLSSPSIPLIPLSALTTTEIERLLMKNQRITKKTARQASSDRTQKISDRKHQQQTIKTTTAKIGKTAKTATPNTNNTQNTDTPLIHTSVLLDTRVDHWGPNSFATHIEDEALSPHLITNDIIIADPHRTPTPSDYVIAHVHRANKTLVRKYREHDLSNPQCFELIALHPDWANVQVNTPKDATIVATVVSMRRQL